jgi:MinD-like ATPase involved in chromosome partitioning or flagellar assembly
MGYPEDAVHLVLNRADSHVGVAPADVHTLLGRWPDVLVPSHRDITRSVNEGRPIVSGQPDSEAAQAFVGLARSFRQDAEASVAPRRVRNAWMRTSRLGSLLPSRV